VGVNLCKLAVQVGLNIYFLVFLDWGVRGALYSALVAETGVGCYVLYYTVRRVGWRFSMSKCRSMIRFGYPFVFVSLGGFLMTSADRYVLNIFGDLETVGLYALAYKFGFILSTVAFMPFNLVWESQRFEIAKREDSRAIFQQVFFYCNIVIVALSLLICLFVRDFLAIMSAPSYLGAAQIVPLILVIYILQIWAAFCNIGLFLKDRSRYMATSALISAGTVMVLLLVLVPRFGAYGAALATIGAWALRFLLVYRYSQTLYPIEYGWAKQSALLASGVVMYGLSRVLEVSSIMGSLAVNTGLMVCFLVLVYRGFLTAEERAVITPGNLLAAMHGVTESSGSDDSGRREGRPVDAPVELGG
jgi:O-antigen/teichoic acid export membrane protein